MLLNCNLIYDITIPIRVVIAFQETENDFNTHTVYKTGYILNIILKFILKFIPKIFKRYRSSLN